MLKKILTVLGVIAGSLLMADLAMALPGERGINFQPAASPSMERITEFHDLLLYIISGITLFVLILLVYVILRFNKRVNPEPSKVTHNVALEIAWTVIPVVILIIIAIPSFKLLYYVDRIENPDMTIKVTGYQWYWQYDYPDHGDISFASYMIADQDIDLNKNQVRLLSTDNPVVLPVNKNIQVLLTGGDVLHSWAVPSLGVKTDTVPGRLNETWFRITREGTYYGQCSELCGKDHAYMPIEIKAVSEEEFARWVAEQGGTMPSVEPEQEEAMRIEPVKIDATQQQRYANLNTIAEGE
ncbi:MAG: cytochrome c oxidase subunit II [Alphaproteobacteria bacterium]